jgi:hypothetical protein
LHLRLRVVMTPPFSAESVTPTEKVMLPAVVGVPVIAPFAASDRPAGSEPLLTVNVYGAVPPLAVTVWL